MESVPLDYETLRVTWWVLLGVLLIAFAVLDGFDLGVAMLLPVLARNDDERRVLINTVAPVWEGNQAWLILGAGAMFAAWPLLYATVFSGLYAPLLAALIALVLRPVGFKFRSKLAAPRWRSGWDLALTGGGLVTTFVFGVAVGNLLTGIPFRLSGDLLPLHDEASALSPFALGCGVLAVAMCAMQGAAWLATKTEPLLAGRARRALVVAGAVAGALFALLGLAAADLAGYVLDATADGNGPSNPLLKSVSRGDGAWMENYTRYPLSIVAPLFGVAGALAAAAGGWFDRPRAAIAASSLAIAGIVATPGLAMFPFMLPSNVAPDASLTVWDASSSAPTLFVMLVCALVFLPVIVAYTAWLYRVMRGPVTVADVHGSDTAY